MIFKVRPLIIEQVRLKNGKINENLKIDKDTRNILNKKLGCCKKRSNELKEIIKDIII